MGGAGGANGPVGCPDQQETPVEIPQGFLVTTRAYKPGSVLTAIYLDAQLLTRSSHLPGTIGQIICPSTALLRIEFTS